jgi:GTP pyrophosphokinase
MRLGGERAVEILQGLGLDETSLEAARLFAEFDGSAKQTESLRKQKGDELADLLVSMRRVSRMGERLVDTPGEEGPAQVEKLRRLLLALADDIRVVVVLLATHLSNLEACAKAIDDGEPDAESMGRALGLETLRVQAPLANRLGIWQIKWALEDLAFRMTDPDAYRAIAAQMDESRQEREAFVTTTITRIRDLLSNAEIEAQVAGRPKHLFSIRNKMRAKELKLEQLMDLRAFRILVATESQCYNVLGLLHDHYKPMDSEFDDYITRPKANGYQSLHTVLLDSQGRPFEVQIRTHDMHHRAELGVAAHWKYKESGGSQAASSDYASRIAWLRQMLDWGRAADDTGRSSAKVRLADDRIYALTPMARIIELPKGATPLDFAYHLHTDIGHRCRGAKVNGHIVPLTSALETGQTVELMTVKQGSPSRDWMNPESGYLKSPRARQKVRTWFHALDLAEGRIEDKSQEKQPEKSEPDSSEAERLKRSEITAEELILSKIAKPKAASKGRVLVVGVDRMLTALARCCKPAPPDSIKGFVTRGRGVSVHRESCPTFQRLQAQAPERVIETDWGTPKDPQDSRYLVDAAIVARTRQDLLKDVAEILAREKIPMAKMDSFPKADRVTLMLTLQVGDGEQLKRALAMLAEVPGVISATRA